MMTTGWLVFLSFHGSTSGSDTVESSEQTRTAYFPSPLQPLQRLKARRLKRRHLSTPDKYHPDKTDVSCVMYFANRTDSDGWPLPSEVGGILRDVFGSWFSDDDSPWGQGGDGQGPPCRESTQETTNNSTSNNSSNNNDMADTPAPTSMLAVDETATPVSSPTEVPSPAPLVDGNFSNSSSNNNSSNSSNNNNNNLLTPAQQESTPSTTPPVPQAYYIPVYQEAPDNSTIQNFARVTVSVAAPPSLPFGVPHLGVVRFITKLLNITSAMRSEELLEDYLAQHSEQSSATALIESLLLQLPSTEVPSIVPLNQMLLFHSKYRSTFHRRQPDHAFFWELVNKPSVPIPLVRVANTSTETVAVPTPGPTLPPLMEVSYYEDATAMMNGTVSGGDNGELARWFWHPVTFRCYTRDQDGTVIPIEDAATLEMLEEQMHQWVDFHINFTTTLLEKLGQVTILEKLGQVAVGIAMPGDEFDLQLDEGVWVDRPWAPPFNSGDSSSSDGQDDDFEKPIVPRTYTEPLLVDGQPGVLETPQEMLGLVVLCSTIAGTIVWSLISMVHRRQKEEQIVWGSNVGTEQALHELLSVGWKVQQDQQEGQEPQQILIIYDKTEHGMGYRDEDSMLMGGYGPPVFHGVTIDT
jgi:hypothetical protein